MCPLRLPKYLRTISFIIWMLGLTLFLRSKLWFQHCARFRKVPPFTYIHTHKKKKRKQPTCLQPFDSLRIILNLLVDHFNADLSPRFKPSFFVGLVYVKYSPLCMQYFTMDVRTYSLSKCACSDCLNI